MVSKMSGNNLPEEKLTNEECYNKRKEKKLPISSTIEEYWFDIFVKRTSVKVGEWPEFKFKQVVIAFIRDMRNDNLQTASNLCLRRAAEICQYNPSSETPDSVLELVKQYELINSLCK